MPVLLITLDLKPANSGPNLDKLTNALVWMRGKIRSGYVTNVRLRYGVVKVDCL